MKSTMMKLATGAALPVLLMAATGAQAQSSLTAGESQTGQITEDSDMLTENVYFLNTHQISGEAGQRVAISMQSEEFDTLLEIGRTNGDQFQQLAMDDDGGDGLNSRLVYTFPETGTYTVRARTFGAGATGTYLIESNILPPPPPPPPPTPVSAGQSVDGTLSVDSPSYEVETYGSFRRHYALYSLTGEEGQSVTITLSSDDFDAYLEVGGMTPLGFAVQQANDDGAAGDGEESIGLNSRLTVTFVQSGTMMIRATTLGGEATGDYTLMIE